MQRFRKKPVEIEAIQFNGIDDYLKVVHQYKKEKNTRAAEEVFEYRTPIMLINTLEGTMAANPGDYIIRGVNGEYYPCKPDIFEKTYEKIDE